MKQQLCKGNRLEHVHVRDVQAQRRQLRKRHTLVSNVGRCRQDRGYQRLDIGVLDRARPASHSGRVGQDQGTGKEALDFE
jgi:hypothetical protein